MKINYRWSLIGLIGLIWSLPGLADRQISVKRFSDIAYAKTLQFPARVINLQLANIAAETSGRITHFLVLVGDLVNKDDVLIQLDCKSAKINQTHINAGIKRLIAKRKLTRQQLDRAKRLSSTSSISREELDQRQTQLDADNASIEEQQALLDSARQNIDHCQIKAPFNGIVIETMSSIGSYVSPGAPLLKLVKQNAVEVVLELPPHRMPQLEQANSILFEVSGFSYNLKIRKVLPVVDSASLQQIVRLEVTQSSVPPGGSFGLVSFDTKRHFIPASYIQKRNGLFGLFIFKNGEARFETLPDAEEGQSVATTLPSDTLIISSQLKLLSDKEKVSIKP